MALRCDICREVAACLLCECKTPPVSVCQRCFSKHIEDVSVEHYQNSAGVNSNCQCSNDGNPAYHFCLCQQYVCSACLHNHYPSRGEHHVFPMSLLPVKTQDSSGALLRQGELVDELSAALWLPLVQGLDHGYQPTSASNHCTRNT